MSVVQPKGSQGLVTMNKKLKYLANYGMCIEVDNYSISDGYLISINVKKLSKSLMLIYCNIVSNAQKLYAVIIFTQNTYKYIFFC